MSANLKEKLYRIEYSIGTKVRTKRLSTVTPRRLLEDTVKYM